MKKIIIENKNKLISLLVVLCLLIVFLPFSNSVTKLVEYKFIKEYSILEKDDKVLIHFINVGQGDACAINFPNGQIALIDVGLKETSFDLALYLEDMVLKDKNTDVIDYVFVSHANNDHIGGIEYLINRYDIKNIIRPKQFASFEELADEYSLKIDSSEYDEYVRLMQEEAKDNFIFAENNMHFDIGDADIDIFYPNKVYSQENNASYFIKLTYNNHSALFTGDAGFELENDICMEQLENVDCDILKVGHHGSKYSTSLEFAQAVTPKIAVISVGGNSYGHPTDKVFQNLGQVDSEIYRTDEKGNIVVTVGDNISVYFDDYFFTPMKLDILKFDLICCAIVIGLIMFTILPKYINLKLKNKKTKKNRT